jgi:hypothetical protein
MTKIFLSFFNFNFNYIFNFFQSDLLAHGRTPHGACSEDPRESAWFAGSASSGPDLPQEIYKKYFLIIFLIFQIYFNKY